MTFKELLLYPKFWIRCSYPYSAAYDDFLNTLMQTEDQYEILVENPYWISFKKKNEYLTFKLWIANRFYAFLSHLEIYSDKAGKIDYKNILPKRITAIRFWLKYRHLILAKANQIENQKQEYFNEMMNYLKK